MLHRRGQQSHLIVASGKVLGAPQRQGMPRAVRTCPWELPMRLQIQVHLAASLSSIWGSLLGPEPLCPGFLRCAARTVSDAFSLQISGLIYTKRLPGSDLRFIWATYCAPHLMGSEGPAFSALCARWLNSLTISPSKWISVRPEGQSHCSVLDPS